MKFIRIRGEGTGLVIECDGGLEMFSIHKGLARLQLKDLSAADAITAVLGPEPEASWVTMIGHWHEVRGPFQILEGLALSDEEFPTQPYDARLLEAPLPSLTSHIFSISSNTVVHMQRAFKVMRNLDLSVADVLKPKTEGLPPGGFTIWPDSVVGPTATITPPRGTRKLDYEAECAVYVRQGGRNLDKIDLWGYTAWNDLGIRDLNLGLGKEGPWTPFSLNLVKNFDTGNACGPWVVVDESREIATLRCRLTVNGESRQDWNLSDMIYSFEETLCYISQFATLRPGDMLTSGTGAGVAIEGGVDGPHWLKPGDVVRIELDGIGELKNVIGNW